MNPQARWESASLARLRILIVTGIYPEESRAGSGAFVFHQVEELKRLGHQVDVLLIRGYRSRLNYLRAPFQVLSRTWKGNYDIVHAHYGLCGLPALIRWRTPLVITLHGSDVLVGRLQPLCSLLACLLADATIAVSVRIASVIPGEVIPTGVDFEAFKPLSRLEARQRLGLPLRQRLILFPFDRGRKVKRHRLAEAAIEELRARGHDAKMLIVSNASSDEMPWYYNAADAMILCSVSEGSPTSVKEALACELPLVSTDVGDVRDITKGISKALICDASVDALASGLEEVFRWESLPEERAKLSAYDQRRTVASIERIYGSVLGNQSHCARSSKVHFWDSLGRILAR